MRIDLTPEQTERCFFDSGFRRSYLELNPKALHAALLLGSALSSRGRLGGNQGITLLPLTDDQYDQIRQLTGKSAAWLAVPHPPPSAFVYEEVWHEGFEPVCLGTTVAIIPAGALAPPEVEHVIQLDPDAVTAHRVFGTGIHPTTRLLLTLLQKQVRFGDRVLDVGTGSGVLAIAAARFGASEVLALDTDETAAAVAGRNVDLNGLNHLVRVRHGALVPEDDGPCDLAVVNLPSAVLVPLMQSIAETLRPEGILLAGGFTGVRLPLLLHAAGKSGFALEGQESLGNWVGLILRREANSR